MANGKKPGNVDPGFNPARQRAPGVTTDLASLLQLLGPMQQRKGEQAAGMVRGMDKSIPRAAIPGEIRGQGLGRPDTTGLTGFYADNPQMRPGEFDPTGRISNRRRSRDYARQDALGAMDFRNTFAQGLMDLQEKMLGGQGGDAIGPEGEPTGAPGGGAGNLMEHNVFDALFPDQTRDDRRLDAEERDEADREAYMRATGIQLADDEELPANWFRFAPGQSPREQRGERFSQEVNRILAQMKAQENASKEHAATRRGPQAQSGLARLLHQPGAWKTMADWKVPEQ